MSDDTPTVGDAQLTQEDRNIQQQKQQQDVSESVMGIEQSIEITQDDKDKAEISAEDQEVDLLTEELSEFISDKIGLDVDENDIDSFSTGIQVLDAIAGGEKKGIGVGTMTIIVGRPGTFKSALVAQIIAAGQQEHDGKMLATFHDSETAMTKERLASMGVVKPYLKPYSDVTVESIFKTIEALASFKALKKLEHLPGIVGWDSIANTSTDKERTTDNINETIGLRARLLSALLPRYVYKLKQYKISLIAVNQLRDKLDMGQFSSPADLAHMGNKEMPGGNALKYNAFHLLFLKSKGDLVYDTYGFNGIKLEAFFIKNKFFPPNIPVMLIVDFNKGISNFWTNYQFLVDQKRLKAGAWNSLVVLPEKKFRTKDAKDLYDSNDAGFKDAFDKEVEETIQREIIDRYKPRM